ncbi:hypothetical protein L1D14_10425 [Vibrio tubiashii]|uniref:hypothetical protein n=1 Tax=Vibrio tubiashii TaxID=29498 RepID=UPI001EFCC29F|nr:hypothetical protein [Vibrio tubiashii]MCG9576652.1 hypothetical protein [Vibrio tubiashii]
MALHVYDHGKNIVEQKLEEREVSILLSKNSTKAQSLLSGYASTKRWLACDCTTPMALMYPRNQSGVYTLVNHYCRGQHDNRCPFFSHVKGTDREEAERDTVDDAIYNLLSRENVFALFRMFPKEEVEEETDDSEEKPKSSSASIKRIDTLLRIYFNCIDSAYQNYFTGNKLNKTPEGLAHQLELARDRTSAMFVKGGQPHLMDQEQLDKMSNPLKDIFFVGEKGYSMAQTFLIKAMRSKKGRARPTALVMLTGDTYTYDKRKRSITLVTEYPQGPTVTHLTDLVKAPIYGADMAHQVQFPVVVIAALTFETQECTTPVIGKVAVHPILGEGSICPVENIYEQHFLKAANFVVSAFADSYPEYAFYITKPMFGFRKHPEMKPSLYLSAKHKQSGKTTRSYIEIVPNSMASSIEYSEKLLKRIEAFYGGNTELFHAYKYPLEKSNELIKQATVLLRRNIEQLMISVK